jgi:long-chain acyl-CoA synthetase
MLSITHQIKAFQGNARVRPDAMLAEPWTVENGMLTPTPKLKRAKILVR